MTIKIIGHPNYHWLLSDMKNIKKKNYMSMVCAKIILPEKCVDWDKSEFSTEQCIKPKVLKSIIKCKKKMPKCSIKDHK